MREGFVAVATVALLETQVDVQVFLVLVLVGKGFVAVFALEFADFPVDDFDVIFEDGGGREFAVAFLARVAFVVVSVVGPHQGIGWSDVRAVWFLATARVAGWVFHVGWEIIDLFGSGSVYGIVRVVHDHVLAQIDCAGEEVVADLARVAVQFQLLLLEVAQFVLGEVAFVVESAPTEGANEEDLVGVRFFVPTKESSSLERLLTSFTLVLLQLLVLVGTDMLPVLANLDELLATRFAGELGILTYVRVPCVIVQRRIRPEPQRAVSTNEVEPMGFEVLVQRQQRLKMNRIRFRTALQTIVR